LPFQAVDGRQKFFPGGCPATRILLLFEEGEEASISTLTLASPSREREWSAWLATSL